MNRRLGKISPQVILLRRPHSSNYPVYVGGEILQLAIDNAHILIR